MTKPKKQNDLIAEALRMTAEFMCNKPYLFSEEQGKALDRALRSCKSISDIDVVWVRWRYVGEQREWLTTDELINVNGTYRYF